MKKFIGKIIIYLITAIFIAGIIYGVSVGDFEDTENVGSIICLSCIGIE